MQQVVGWCVEPPSCAGGGHTACSVTLCVKISLGMIPLLVHVHAFNMFMLCPAAAAPCLSCVTHQVWIILELCTGGTLLDAALAGKFKWVLQDTPQPPTPTAPDRACESRKMAMVGAVLCCGCSGCCGWCCCCVEKMCVRSWLLMSLLHTQRIDRVTES